MDLKKHLKRYITISELAKKLGTSQPSLTKKIQRGTFSAEEYERIAEVLNIPVYEIFMSDEELQSVSKYRFCPFCGKELK